MNYVQKIKWACTFNNCVPMIKNGSLKIIEHTNLAYVEPHRVIIVNDKIRMYKKWKIKMYKNVYF